MLPGVTVTVTNVDTGAERSVITNEKGLYRAPLLPLGTYKVVAELQGFKKFEGTDIKLSVGQTAVVNATLSVGTVSETITVSSTDMPGARRRAHRHRPHDDRSRSAQPAAGRAQPVQLRARAAGRDRHRERRVRRAAPGRQRRGDAHQLQIDGNTNTEKDRAGLRLLPMSEVMIQEVKVVTTGFAPEFGQTMGMVYNAVTPSGTNTFRGDSRLSVPPEAVQRVPVLLRLHRGRVDLRTAARSAPRAPTRRSTPARPPSAARS